MAVLAGSLGIIRSAGSGWSCEECGGRCPAAVIHPLRPFVEQHAQSSGVLNVRLGIMVYCPSTLLLANYQGSLAISS